VAENYSHFYVLLRTCQGEFPMPIYEYKCSACARIFEILTTSSTREESVHCRYCQSDKVNKIMSSGSFRQGSGMKLPVSGPTGCGNKSGFS
jgi:putative FmdB family regulatory protein